MSHLHDLLADLPGPDTQSATAVAARAADILRPTGALQRFDDIATWMAGWQATESPAVSSPVTVAAARVAGLDDPLELLREVGGAELAALAAAIVAARHRRIPVVLDGYVVSASALPLAQAVPGALDHCSAGHVSAEPGHGRLLDHLGLEPLLDLGMRLGEGSGAMAAVPLVAMACRAVTEVPTFTEWFTP